jgi:hypothetical protein
LKEEKTFSSDTHKDKTTDMEKREQNSSNNFFSFWRNKAIPPKIENIAKISNDKYHKKPHSN